MGDGSDSRAYDTEQTPDGSQFQFLVRKVEEIVFFHKNCQTESLIDILRVLYL